MKKFLLSLVLVLLVAPGAFAQITVPNTFISGTTILASAVNANFDKLESDALNRTAGTMTGHLLFSPDNTKDIGASGATRPRDIFAGRKIYTYDLTLTNDLQGVTATFSGAVTAGGLTFSSGAITGLTALSVSGTATATTFSGSGASLTNIPETAIVDGSLLARVGGNETVTGQWTFDAATTPITVAPGGGTSAFQAVTGTTGVFSSTVQAGGAGFTGGGANITGIAEANITDGSVLARVGGNETISGTWTFSNAITVGSTVLPTGIGLTVADLGGDWREYVTGTGYPSGATFDKLVPGSGVWYINAYALPGTYGVEAVCAANTGTPNITIAAFDLDGGTPDAALTGSETVAAGSTTGVRIRSTAITFANAARTIGVKVKIASGSVACRGIRIIRLS
jgi:hypothetical protein